MSELAFFELCVVLVCGFFVGFSKTAGTTLSSIIIPFMSDVFPAKEATGILAIAFFLASFHAVYHYRHHIQWNYFAKLIPPTLVGLGVGALFMQEAANDEIRLIVGLIILGLLGINMCQPKMVSVFEKAKRNYLLVLLCGLLMGFSSMVANSGSSVLVIYMLIQRENKREIIGTIATFFFFTDLIKIPIGIWTNVITLESFKLSCVMAPLMVLGGIAGVLFVKWISEHRFRRLLEIMTFLGGLKLVYRPILNLI